MNKKPTYWRWLLGLALMLFIWGSSGNVFAQSQTELAKQAIIDAMHGPTVEVPYSEGTRAVGDNCTEPIVVNIPADLPYADLGNTTCGRGNTYSNTDLGDYDGGEDIIYELNVTATTEVTITLDSKTSSWSGLGLFTSCPTAPLGVGNYWRSTSSGSVESITQTLDPGTYYVMADTWPSPTCIPELDLTITAPLPIPANDLCADAELIACGDIINGNTTPATNTGAPTSCSLGLNTAPGVWYSFIADGVSATISLAGSTFDTRLGVFSGTCGSLTCIDSDDDGGPGVTSELTIPTTIGEEYIIYVTGYSTRSGPFTLTLTCDNPGLEILNPSLALGHRPIGAWMEPARFEIVNNPGAGDLSITAVDIDNNYGGFVNVVAPTLPYTLASGETTTEFGLTANVGAAATPGPFNGEYAIIFGGNRALAMATYSGTAYEPLSRDVVETALDLGEFGPEPVEPFTISQPTSRELFGYYKNYILPNDVGNGPLENDFVYKMTFLTDKLVNISSPQSPNLAIYAEDFGGEPGPMAHNAIYQNLGDFTDVPVFAGTYYLVVSDIMNWESISWDIVNMPVPDAVTNVAPPDGAFDIENGDMLSWTFGNNVSEYELVLGTTYPPTTVVVPYTTDLATSYTLTGLQPNMQYFWRVNVRNTQGETEGPVWGFTTTIDVPTDLTATIDDTDPTIATVDVELDWEGPSDRAFLGYIVYRDAIALNTIPLPESNYTDQGVARNTTHTYTVTAMFDEGESDHSDPVTITTKGVGIFNGFVYDFLTNDPIEGARVEISGTEGYYSVLTAANGAYSTQAFAGSYEFTVSATGYTTQIRAGQNLAHGGTVANDFYLMEVPYPVAEVVAFELNDNSVQISWDGSGPEPPAPKTFRHDDGTSTGQLGFGSGSISSIIGSVHNVDATLTEMSWYTTSEGGPHATVQIYVLGLTSAGLPDGSNVLYTASVANLDNVWNVHVFPTPIEAPDGFFLAAGYNGFLGLSTDDGEDAPYEFAPNTHFYNIDYSSSSFSTFESLGGDFEVNAMIRAYGVENAVLAPAIPDDNMMARVKDSPLEYRHALPAQTGAPVWKTRVETTPDATRGIVSYDIWREKVYQPGTLELIGTTLGQQNYVDFDWGIQDWGVYRWAVTVNYDENQVSVPTFSNTLDKDMNTVVDVTVALNSGDSPLGTLVTFTNTSEPNLELVYEETLGSSGEFTWDMFRKGVYDIDVFKAGYTPVAISDVDIFDETSFDWLLIEILAPPADLYVTPTGFATWSGGIGTPFEPFMESFDGLENGALPEGWTKSPETNNWGAYTGTQAGGVAPQMRFSWYPSGTDEYYLKTPVMSTIGQSSLQLSFKHFINDYNGNYTLRVVAIADGTEHIIHEWLTPEDLPSTTEVYNLTSGHGVGAAEFQIAWVFEGYTFNINQWYLDDVALMGGAKAPKSFETYKVFHDGVFVADVEETMYQYGTNGEELVDGETYLAEVATAYSTGQSARASYTWTYIACDNYATPGDFAAAQVEGTLNVDLSWTIPTIPVGEDQIDFARIYRDGEVIVETQDPMYLDEDLELGTYEYCITFVYETGAETCPATLCETVDVIGGGFVNGNVSQAAYLGGDDIEGAVLTLTNTTDPNITFTFTTDADGNYDGEVLAGMYDYEVVALGYITATLEDVDIPQSGTVTHDFVLMEFPTPVELVVATELSDAAVQITWRTPGAILFEPMTETFDSGIPASWTVVVGGNSADTWYMETPAGNPQTSGASLDGTNFAYVDSDEAGSSVDMDEMLVSPVFNTMGAEQLFLEFDQYYRHLGSGTYGKVEVYDGAAWVTVLNQTTTAGSWTAPNHQSIDVTAYANENFQVRFHYFDASSWAWYWAVDNFTLTDEAPTRSPMAPPTSTLAGYNVYRTTCAEGGDLQLLGYTLDTLFNDNTWVSAESGVYKWAVEAVYAENESEVRFSNCLDKDMNTVVSVLVNTNSGDSPEGTSVMFTNTSEPELELVYTVTLDSTGYYAWEEFRKGVYDIHVEKNGFAAIDIADDIINGPTNYEWLLDELLLPVSDLHVSPTGFATWRSGGVIPFEPFVEDFSEGIDNWTRIPETDNWQLSQTSLAGGESPEVRFYWSPNTTNRFYFISPMMNTLSQMELEMSFDHFISDFGGGYTIELVAIADGVETLVMDFPAADAPATNVVTTLTAAHGVGAAEFQIAFVYEGAAWDINWWNIDNIMLYTPGSRELTNYKIWLDGVWIDDPVETFYQYDQSTLVPGQEYYSEVAAMYDNGMSPKMDYTWVFYPCDSFPGPEDLAYEVVDINDVVLTWGGSGPPPPPPGGGIDEDFEGGSLPADWTVDQTNTTTTGPTPAFWTINDYISADFSPFGTYHAGLWWEYSHQDEWLITPEFTCDADATLEFWSAVYEGSVNGDHYYVKVSNDGGSNWTVLWDASALTGNAWNYYASPYNIDLAAYAGDDIKLAFQAVDGDNQGLWYIWFIDNITVGSPTRTIAFNTESLIRKSASTGSNDQIARDGNTARIERNNHSEMDANAENRTVETSREMWDLEFSFDIDNPSGLTGLAGAETDGEFIYATKWAGTEIVKFDLDGNFIETFSIPGVSGLRDLAFDGTYMYGGAAATTIYKMDFTNKTLVSSFTAPTAVRAIAYDDDLNAFWGNNWSDDMVLFDESGATLNTLTGMPSMYGAAYDNFSDGGPYLWFFTGTTTGGGCQVEQYDIAGSALTGVSHSVSGAIGDVIAGGLYISENLVTDKVVIGGTAQGTPDLAFAFELIDNSGGGGGGGGSTFDPGEFMGANVYRNGELIAEMIQEETYTDMDVEPGYYDYCVTFVYEGNAMSCMTSCVEDVLVTEDCQVPQNLTATGVEDDNEVTLAWNQSIAEEFRYDDGTSTGQLGFQGGTINGVLGAKHDATAEITELSWFTTAEGGPHNTVQIYVFGLTSAGMPNGSDVLYTASVTNTDETWNTHTLPTPVMADGGFYIALGYNGFAGLATDDGIGAPYVYQNNTHYYASDYTSNSWTTFESSGFSVNAMIRAIGIVDSKASYAVAPETAPEMAAEFDKTLNPVIYTISNPVETGTPQWSVPVANRYMNRAFLGYNIYRDGSLLEALWPETTYVYNEGNAGETCYTVTAEYEFCGETEPSNIACVDFETNVESTDLSQIRVYPNPSNHTVNIDLTSNISQVVIYNYLGQVVYENNITDQTTLPVDVRNYEAGAYLVKLITNEGQSLTKKVVVTK